jgi:hypothetical protein
MVKRHGKIANYGRIFHASKAVQSHMQRIIVTKFLNITECKRQYYKET